MKCAGYVADECTEYRAEECHGNTVAAVTGFFPAGVPVAKRI
jgi:hypothetical protein